MINSSSSVKFFNFLPENFSTDAPSLPEGQSCPFSSIVQSIRTISMNSSYRYLAITRRPDALAFRRKISFFIYRSYSVEGQRRRCDRSPFHGKNCDDSTSSYHRLRIISKCRSRATLSLHTCTFTHYTADVYTYTPFLYSLSLSNSFVRFVCHQTDSSFRFLISSLRAWLYPRMARYSKDHSLILTIKRSTMFKAIFPPFGTQHELAGNALDRPTDRSGLETCALLSSRTNWNPSPTWFIRWPVRYTDIQRIPCS